MRKEFNLDSAWRFQHEVVSKENTSHSAAYSAVKAGGASGAAAMDYDDSDWRVVNLPHDFGSEGCFREENHISGAYLDRANAWYRRSFCLPQEFEGKQIFLVFEGISVYSEIYFNGSLMAHSFSGSVPITVDLTDRAYYGDRGNVIAVHVDGKASEGWWYNGAGIYRHVKIYVKDPLHIDHDGLWIKPVCLDLDAGKWRVDGEITVENSFLDARSGKVELSIFDSENTLVANAGTTVTCEGYSKNTVGICVDVVNPRLWNVEKPNLYRVCVTLTDGKNTDCEQVRIGFRTFTADPDKGFFLNGKSIKLKGVCNHQDHAGVGIAVPDAIQRERLLRLKEMGCNAYRCAHHLHAREILDFCDELGLLVMDENRKFESDTEHMAHYECMVRRDRNHPSVVMYSLFNEETLQGAPEGRNMFQRIRQRLLRMDDTRIYTGAMNGGYRELNGTASVMDAIGLNYKIGERAQTVHSIFPDQVVYGSENNSEVTTRGCYVTDRQKHVLNCYDEEIVPWGQSIRETWDFVRSNEWFGGIFVWTGFDYLGEPTPFEWPSVSSQFGLMDRCGFPKDGFYQCKACFDDAPMVWITPHWNWSNGDRVRVMVATNCSQVELFLNGKSLGKKDSDCCALPEWLVDFEEGTLRAVGYRDGNVVAETEQRTGKKASKILLEPSRWEIADDGVDAISVNVSIVDENGIVLETDDRKIAFEIVGDGVLLGVGNGDPNCHEGEHDSSRSLYAGHAQMIVGSVLGGQLLKIRATADGLPTEEISIGVRHVEAPVTLSPSSQRFLHHMTVSATTYLEKPDATMEIADNDMNSFEPLNPTLDAYVPGHREGWKLVRTKVEMPNLRDAEVVRCTLNFSDVRGDLVEIYANGMFVGKREKCEGAESFIFDIPYAQMCELRFLILAVPGKVSGLRINASIQVDKKS